MRTGNREPLSDDRSHARIHSAINVRLPSGNIRLAVLQSCLDPAGQRSEVGDSLQFVVGKLDLKMMFQPGQQVQSLQAVNPKRLEEIVVWSEFRAGP